jgi:hypothetical protein
MAVQEIPIDLVTASSDGPIKSVNGQLVVDSTTTTTEFTGNFDDVQGVLVLNIPNLGTLRISGFPTTTAVGVGQTGNTGASGRDGVDGTLGADGQRGADGCVGSQGQRGEVGKTGSRGQQGEQGQRGPTGEKGPTGADGVIKVYMQADEPVDAGIVPGSVWIKT